MVQTMQEREPQRDREWRDREWMERALALAARSVGLASPNPCVGCVLVRTDSGRDQVVGEGWHEYDRKDHAEIAALRQAGSLAQRATAYVTLEPCSHQGRTGPCADALIAAGVSRVVAATRDPNPAVSGRGIEKLRAAGVEVEVGLLEQAARRQNDAFARHIQSGLPLVDLKIASSLDGRIARARSAPGDGAPAWITGEESRAEVHRMRHAADVLLTGIGTVLADDPLLTDRSGLPRRRPLLRVVLDSTLRLPPESQLARTANNDLAVFFTEADAAAQCRLQAAGVRLVKLASEGRSVPLLQALRYLGREGFSSVLAEGGSRLNAALLEQGLVDRLTIFYAPVLLGPDAMPMLDCASSAQEFAWQSEHLTWRQHGRDAAFQALLRDPWGPAAHVDAQEISAPAPRP